MPRGQKSKLRAREKRGEARSDTHGLECVQATTEEEEASPTPSTSFGDSQQSSPPAPSHKECERVPFIFTAFADVGANKQDEGPPSTEKSQKDPVIWRASLLLQLLLHKYKMKEPITTAEMMKIINKKYKEHFPQIFRRVSEHMELVFGLELKEVDPKGQSYVLVSQLEITKQVNLSGCRGFPKQGLLMPLLGVIYMNNNLTSEEKIWEYLNELGIYDGKRHFIFGDPRKLITKDLVQEKYVEYRQVPGSDPPRYEFLWGPRAHTEECKTKVMQYLDKIKNIDTGAFQALYEATWRYEEEKGEATVWSGRNARAMARFRAKSSRSSHP